MTLNKQFPIVILLNVIIAKLTVSIMRARMGYTLPSLGINQEASNFIWRLGQS